MIDSLRKGSMSNFGKMEILDLQDFRKEEKQGRCFCVTCVGMMDNLKMGKLALNKIMWMKC